MADQAERLRTIIKSAHTTLQPINSLNSGNPARVIAVTSGKGGVGKTNFSVNVGIALAQLGQRVLLVDADLGLANADVVMGVTPKFHLGHVLSGQKQVNEVIQDGPAGMKILAGGSGDYELANLGERGLASCIASLNEIEKDLDFIILDTGAGISNSVLKFVLAAGEVIIVTTTEPTSITDAYGIIKVVATTDPNILLRVVVNMARDTAEGQQVMERLTAVSKRFLGISLANIGFVTWDQTVSKAVKEQRPFIIGHPRSVAAQDITQIAKNILDRAVNSKKGSAKNFFERLLEKLR
jgi:flagellar biosynthesis protein FlhG